MKIVRIRRVGFRVYLYSYTPAAGRVLVYAYMWLVLRVG